MPKISFVVPTHNRVEWLPLCIESLLGQTEQDIEIIVVNDGSTDGTDEFLEYYEGNPRVRVIRNETAQGAGISRNLGMTIAQSDIVASADDDDVYINTHAEQILRWFREHPESELVNFPYVSIDYFENVVDEYRGEDFNHEAYAKDESITYFCNPSAAYKKDAAQSMGGYPKEKDGLTDDVQFIKNWVASGRTVDFCGNDGADHVPFAVMHRILPNSMMAKIRGFNPEWVQPKGAA
jgi:glycosyltransferase involved in cell wall biosynthesis